MSRDLRWGVLRSRGSKNTGWNGNSTKLELTADVLTCKARVTIVLTSEVALFSTKAHRRMSSRGPSRRFSTTEHTPANVIVLFLTVRIGVQEAPTLMQT
mmetsp:Transcript_81895/g.228210  ORF Transcript_81895/g.228210 Transcript_81895/m.228210 type:complete len:99 (-) Transcript_81895:1534-1830(-)